MDAARPPWEGPTYVIESGPSSSARMVTTATRLMLRTALNIGCQVPHLPWPYGAVEHLARAMPKIPRVQRVTIPLPHASAELIHAPGVGDRTGRVILYFHGGAFLTCGTNTHAGMIARLSQYSDAPVLAVNYRKIPTYSVSDAVQDGLDAYYWLRECYDSGQIVLAGDSAGGYLAMAVTNFLRFETPAALALISPLLELDPEPKKAHPNIKSDAMFGASVFNALASLIERANEGCLYEPLDHLRVDTPRTLIHVSGHEVLLHDAHLAADCLSHLGVPVEIHEWPGQIHVFQIVPFLPEATQSLEHIGRYIIDATSNNRQCYRNDLTIRTGVVG